MIRCSLHLRDISFERHLEEKLEKEVSFQLYWYHAHTDQCHMHSIVYAHVMHMSCTCHDSNTYHL